MPDLSSFQHDDVIKVISGSAGSVVSLRFVQGTWYEKILMTFGGAVLSYFATQYVADYVGMQNAEGLVGFLIGLFGMAIASKLYEVIQVIDTKSLSKNLVNWLLRRPSSKED